MAFALNDGTEHIGTWSSSSRGKVPTRRLLKDVIRVGDYTHPATGKKIFVDRDRIDKWVANFQKMAAGGDEVPVVVDHSFRAQDQIGTVVDAFRDGDKMMMVHELLGDDAISLADRVKNVSVFVEENHAVGSGDKYDEAVLHSSLCQMPVVAGQGDWEDALAVFSLVSNKGLEMDFKKLQEFTGINELTADNVESKLIEYVGTLKTTADETKTALSGATDKIATLEGKITDLAAKSNAGELDRNVAEALGQSAENEFQSLVLSGRLTPDCAKKLVARLCGDRGKRNGFALSIGKDQDQSFALGIIDDLKSNDPVILGEQTKSQTKFSAAPNPGEAKPEDTQKRVAEMEKMAFRS